MKTYFIFLDAAYEMDFRNEIDSIVSEYVIIPKVFYRGEISQFDDIVWPGYRIGIILRANENILEILEKWKDKLIYFVF
ncbi:MAG: hypothetical protein N2504_00055 [candidate division WOR-3 bacterium]|nr:hypothetical protein [candidate division WOR-3 bacterium]MCX7946972.1 hypothetical protein [candidate division WOR-3 bacterium]MDW8149987.1 hypothetical protein [candidate division WOR-3 bacterium]